MTTRHRRTWIRVSLVAVTGFCAAPMAVYTGQWSSGYPGSGVEYARVVGVQPNVVYVESPSTSQDCYQTPGHYVAQPRESRSSAPAVIAGGVVGGLVGNNVGSGRGRDAARIAGALAGAAIGHDIATNRQQPTTQIWVPGTTHCQPRTTHSGREHVDGYTVTYEYRGRYYTTHSREYPGSTIPIELQPAPLRR